MAKEDKRFIRKKADSSFTSTTYILIDRQTGVNYLFHHEGYAGGLTPLLDSTGKVIVSPAWETEEE